MSVFWFLSGNEKAASSRIHGINIHKFLRKKGLSSIIIQKPSNFSNDIVISKYYEEIFKCFLRKSDTVIFQKLYGKRTIGLAKYLKEQGIRIIFVDCDLPLKKEIAQIADCVITPSTLLKEQYLEAGCDNIKKIDDAVEFSSYPGLEPRSKKRIVWFGSGKGNKWEAVNWFKIEVLPFLNECFEFVTISDHEEADVQWSLSSFQLQLKKSDISVIPVIGYDHENVKSANRVTQSLAYGLPVVCGEIKSYTEIVNSDIGLVSNNAKDWINFINKLKDDVFLKELKKKSYIASQNFLIKNIIHQWIYIVGEGHTKKFTSYCLQMFNFTYHHLIKVSKILLKK
jgi:glycosyltransferase involved in cell wall biosynthesis